MANLLGGAPRRLRLRFLQLARECEAYAYRVLFYAMITNICLALDMKLKSTTPQIRSLELASQAML